MLNYKLNDKFIKTKIVFKMINLQKLYLKWRYKINCIKC